MEIPIWKQRIGGTHRELALEDALIAQLREESVIRVLYRGKTFIVRILC